MASIRHTCNTEDKFYDDEQNFLTKNGPLFHDAVLDFYRAVLANPAKSALADRFGAILLEKMEVLVKSSIPEVLALRAGGKRP